MSRMKVAFSVAMVASIFAVSVPASAGILDGNPNAFVSGSAPFDASGAPFLNPNLNGTIDYAVFNSGDFAAAFPASGYTPGGPLVYAYQIDNVDSAFDDDVVTELRVGLQGPASDISAFDNAASDIETSNEFFLGPADAGGFADWEFFAPSPGIDDGDLSQILVFSSTNLPEIPPTGVSIVFNGGTFSLAVPVTTPGQTAIPEPSSIVLISLLGALGFCAFRRYRQR